MRSEAAVVAAFVGLEDSLDTPLRQLGSSRARLLAHAVALHVDLPVLVAEEPLSPGGEQVREATYRRLEQLRDAGTTLVLVTNTARELERLCTRGLVLHEGTVLFDGPVPAAIRQYRRRGRGKGGESS
jgi:ABC-2 type transport system ATP-binding protein